MIRLRKKTAAKVVERPGLEGYLKIFSRHLGKGTRLQHEGPARLLAAHDGLVLFLDIETGKELWLAVDEVVSFSTGSGAS
jgi:ABC-type taurine transport system ATPase subunit